ncbi:hypothetical protein KAR91_45540 [Candidatus Pacearchaeota archaeon]|nr:hypothetical protein [Candidatus Pacearchaeota archaeon]
MKRKSKLEKRLSKSVRRAQDRKDRLFFHKGGATKKGCLGDGSALPWRKGE